MENYQKALESTIAALRSAVEEKPLCPEKVMALSEAIKALSEYNEHLANRVF